MKYLLLILATVVFSFNLAIAQEESSTTNTQKDYFTENNNNTPDTPSTEEATPQPPKKATKPRKNRYGYQFDAISSGDVSKVESMRDDSIHYYRKNDKGQTALTLAIINQDVAMVEVLTKRAVINLKNDEGESPLTLAIKNGNIEIINLVVKRAKTALKNDAGETPLYLAIQLDDLYLLKTLISKGANVNRKSNGITPLARAAELNRPKAVAFLIKNNATISAPNDNGDTPLYIAINKGHDIVAGILLSKSKDASGDANWENQIGTPLLQLASANGNAEIVRILIRNGSEIEATDYMDNTALCIASELGKDEVIRALLQNNANINHQNMKGDTPLMLASANNNDGAVTLLLESGADATLMNYLGYAAADFYSDDVLNGLFAARGAKQTTVKENSTQKKQPQLNNQSTNKENNQ